MASNLPPPSRDAESLTAVSDVSCVCVRVVQLLNDWVANPTVQPGIKSLSGTVYNCPGAYDGATSHRTSNIVDCSGRMLRTVEGAEYYLGYRKADSVEQRALIQPRELLPDEAKELGLLEDDALAV